MTFTPEQWKEHKLPPSQWDNLTLRNALKDIQELAAQLAVYREAWEAKEAYSNRIGDDQAEWETWQATDAAVRKMRGEK